MQYNILKLIMKQQYYRHMIKYLFLLLWINTIF